MELKIKARVDHLQAIEEIIERLVEIEKRHSCCCALEIKINCSPETYQVKK
ncbi:hypothetical protein [Dehalobacterium formicoaceticum]|uniref:hypothetical protein n=1 Tax=Dehalobacterium formicoaceticum TaxID=51515 RepID=UPI0012FAFA17|nr:hypothetical protein [Dehalobacterium formicoaceticum]